MKPAKLLFATVAIVLASSAWAQTLPKDTEIKVRTDTAIPAKAEANAKYEASVCQGVTDSSGSLVIPRGSRAQLVAVPNGNGTNLDLRSMGRAICSTLQTRTQLPEVWARTSAPPSTWAAEPRLARFLALCSEAVKEPPGAVVGGAGGAGTQDYTGRK